jgi:hypothetical protein
VTRGGIGLFSTTNHAEEGAWERRQVNDDCGCGWMDIGRTYWQQSSGHERVSFPLLLPVTMFSFAAVSTDNGYRLSCKATESKGGS